MKKKNLAKGRPKSNGEKKEKINARLYPSQEKKIKELGFKSVQAFLDHHIPKGES